MPTIEDSAVICCKPLTKLEDIVNTALELEPIFRQSQNLTLMIYQSLVEFDHPKDSKKIEIEDERSSPTDIKIEVDPMAFSSEFASLDQKENGLSDTEEATDDEFNKHAKEEPKTISKEIEDLNEKEVDDKTGKKVICPDCGKSYSNKAGYNQHRNSMHLKITKTYTCPYCNEEVTALHFSQFYVHREKCMVIYTGKTDNHKCEKCGETFALLKQLENHKFKCYKPKRPWTKWKGYKCTYDGCCYATCKKERLENHIRTKHLNLPKQLNYMCTQCGNKYAEKRGLKYHIEVTHSNPDDKPFQCSQCTKCFKTQQLTKEHEKIHSDVLSYMCSFCGKGFKQSSVLYRHKLNCQFKPG